MRYFFLIFMIIFSSCSFDKSSSSKSDLTGDWKIMSLTKDGEEALWLLLVIIIIVYSVFFGHYKTILIYLLVLFFLPLV